MIKFFGALAVLLLALLIQFQLAGIGIYFNLVFALLITFAFTFNFLEFLCLDLVATFLINWQPGPSVALVAFAVIPLIIHFIRKILHTDSSLGNLVGIFLGFLIFYLIAAPSFLHHQFGNFLEDVVVGLAVGELALFALN